MAKPAYLTTGEICKRLEARRVGRRFKDFHAEVERVTGMAISKSHLANILSGRKRPNDVVMRYLGGTVEKSVVYQIERPVARKRSAKRERAKR